MEIKVSKIEAVRRQLESAIRLLFGNEDPIAIHTIVAASSQVVRDLARHRGIDFFRPYIKEGKEKLFWAGVNRPANFLKHANRDPDPNAMLEGIDENLNDYTIFFACCYYQGLGYALTKTMNAFMAWFSVLHPDLILSVSPLKPWLDMPEISFVRQMHRREQIKIGLEMLRIAKKEES